MFQHFCKVVEFQTVELKWRALFGKYVDVIVNEPNI